MCGILGCFHDKSLDYPLDAFRSSLEKISHRGPDNISAVEYVSEDLVFKFGHTRLSILDLNQTGNQPMISRDGRYVLIFNGEIYNHQKLRKELSAKYEIEWSGSSDSETLLMLLQKEQPKIALKRLEGMFAFSFFDRSTFNDLTFKRPIIFSGLFFQNGILVYLELLIFLIISSISNELSIE